MGNHAEHLKQYRWQSGGPSPNPGGRRKRPITRRYQALAERPLPEELRLKLKQPEGTTYGDVVALAILTKAMTGDVSAAKEVREAIEGKSRQRLELFRDDFEEEAKPPTELQQKIMELDPVDRNLLVVATQKANGHDL